MRYNEYDGDISMDFRLLGESNSLEENWQGLIRVVRSRQELFANRRGSSEQSERLVEETQRLEL